MKSKRVILTVLLIAACTGLHAAVPAGNYPALAGQIDAMRSGFSGAIDVPAASAALDDYLSSTNTDFPADMRIVLQPDYYRDYLASRTAPIAVDGSANDWARVSFKADDPAGDGIGGAASGDVTGMAFTLDTNGSAALLIRTAGVPAKNQTYYILFDYDRDWKYEAEAVFYWWTDGKLYCQSIDLARGNARNDIPAEVGIGSAFEAKFAMSDLPYPAPSAPFRVYCGIAERGGNRYDGAGAVEFDPHPVNYALELLLWLVQNKCYEKNDPITMALALANDYIYSIADEATRAAIRSDVLEHYRFYKEIVADQAASGVNYPLRAVPLIPKIFWADRSSDKFWQIGSDMRRFHTAQLTPAVYRDFVDRLPVLEEIRKTALEQGLVCRSLAVTASTLEEWVHAHRTYRASIENLVDFNKRGIFSDADLAAARAEIDRGQYFLQYNGTNRRWDDFRWMNYQWNLYKTTGRFRGDCGDTTTVQMAFYRAIGVCPVSLQYMGLSGAGAEMHNFPGHYNPRAGRWFTYQKPSIRGYGGVHETGVDMYFYIAKPVYHHWLYRNDWHKAADGAIYYGYYQGERSDSDRIANFLTLGIDPAQFDRIFLTNLTQSPGQFFDDRTAPRVIADADGDGLADALESRYGTSSTSPDTDGDGLSDRYEIDWGFDPADKHDPASPVLPALDGLAGNEIAAGGMTSVSDPRSDFKPTLKSTNDLKSFSARLYGQNLYLAASFYNDFRRSVMRDMVFYVVFKDRYRDGLWINFYGNSVSLSTVKTNRWSQWRYGTAGIESALLEDGEYLVPLSLLRAAGAPATFWVFPRVCGRVSPTNAYVSDADTGNGVRFSLDPDDPANRLDRIFAGAQSTDDPAGDCDAVSQAFDIAKVSVQTTGGLLYVRATYHNRFGDLPFGYHTVWIKDPATKENWWVQWWDMGHNSVWFWKDGEPSKKLDADYTAFDCIPQSDGYVFAVPISLFAGHDPVEVRYCASGIKADGSVNYNADKTDPVIVKMR